MMKRAELDRLYEEYWNARDSFSKDHLSILCPNCHEMITPGDDVFYDGEDVFCCATCYAESHGVERLSFGDDDYEIIFPKSSD